MKYDDYNYNDSDDGKILTVQLECKEGEIANKQSNILEEVTATTIHSSMHVLTSIMFYHHHHHHHHHHKGNSNT